MRKALAAAAVALVVVVAPSAQAQDVKVTLMDGSTVSAALDRLTDTEVVLRETQQTYPRTGSRRVVVIDLQSPPGAPSRCATR